MSHSTEILQDRDSVTAYLIAATELDEKVIKRFTDKVEVLSSGCWRWTATVSTPAPANPGALAYGRFSYQGRLRGAHRWLWQQINGPVPEDLVLDHFLANVGECIGASCVNPAHLELVTFGENVRRGVSPSAKNARKTTCPEGHEYDVIDSEGYRRCSKCLKENRRRKRAENRAAARKTELVKAAA